MYSAFIAGGAAINIITASIARNFAFIRFPSTTFFSNRPLIAADSWTRTLPGKPHHTDEQISETTSWTNKPVSCLPQIISYWSKRTLSPVKRIHKRSHENKKLALPQGEISVSSKSDETEARWVTFTSLYSFSYNKKERRKEDLFERFHQIYVIVMRDPLCTLASHKVPLKTCFSSCVRKVNGQGKRPRDLWLIDY